MDNLFKVNKTNLSPFLVFRTSTMVAPTNCWLRVARCNIEPMTLFLPNLSIFPPPLSSTAAPSINHLSLLIISPLLALHNLPFSKSIMAPRRRTAATGQSTLAFGGRVTKPSTTPTTLHKAKNEPAKTKATSGTPKPASLEVSEPSGPVVTELVVRQQTKPTRKPSQTAEEKRALGLKVKDLRKYWDTKGGSRDSFRGKPEAARQRLGNPTNGILRQFTIRRLP